MPKEILQYYRYRKIYPANLFNSPVYKQALEVDEYLMSLNVPINSACCLYNKLEWNDKITGAHVIDYFEDEGDMMRYKAALYDDHTIYTTWLEEQRESKELYNFKMEPTNDRRR